MDEYDIRELIDEQIQDALRKFSKKHKSKPVTHVHPVEAVVIKNGQPGKPGEPGDPGKDGLTPIVVAGRTISIPAGEPARVEERKIDGGIALDFFIPNGELIETTVERVKTYVSQVIGKPGRGIPKGGTDGQLIAKDGDTPYKTKWVNPAAGGDAFPGEDTVISWNANGTIAAKVVGETTYTYTYDGPSGDRLHTKSDGVHKITYHYDANGHITNKTISLEQ